MTELRARWEQETGRQRAAFTIAALRRGRPLAELGFVGRHEGRWDLRGISVAPVAAGRRYRVAEHEFEEVVGATQFTGTSVVGIDLSGADLTHAVFERVEFEDVVFDASMMRSVGFWACGVRNCSFRGADLTGASMGGHLGAKCSQFVDTSFARATMRETSHTFEIYRGCDFSSADLRKVDFDGARFEGCTFAGLLEEVEFHRHSRFLAQPLLPWRRLDARSFSNAMASVDMSMAELRWVLFYGVDLSACRFPNDEWHVVVHDPRATFTRIREELRSRWTPEAWQNIAGFLSDTYIGDGHRLSPASVPERTALPVDVVNRNDLREVAGDELGDELFAMLRESERLRPFDAASGSRVPRDSP